MTVGMSLWVENDKLEKGKREEETDSELVCVAYVRSNIMTQHKMDRLQDPADG